MQVGTVSSINHNSRKRFLIYIITLDVYSNKVEKEIFDLIQEVHNEDNTLSSSESADEDKEVKEKINRLSQAKNEFGYTALMVAIENNLGRVILRLLDLPLTAESPSSPDSKAKDSKYNVDTYVKEIHVSVQSLSVLVVARDIF